jgi:Fe-S cluster biogenesis protein NfuA
MTVAAVTLEDCASAVADLNGHIRSHGGLVEVVDLDGDAGRLTVRMQGLCSSCPAWPATLYGLIRPHIRETLGVPDVQVEGRRLSSAAALRLQSALGGGPDLQ